jgi:hypothetical protein
MILPKLVEGVLYCGVFDGHSEEGAIVAERAAQTLGKELASALQWLADSSPQVSCPCACFAHSARDSMDQRVFAGA